jgi:hypothetical protein
MAIIYAGKKLTPTELAKWILSEGVEMKAETWHEDSVLDGERLTDREQKQINDAINKQVDRIWKFLNLNKIYNKIHS